MNLAAVTWELSRAPEAVSALAAAAGLRTGADVAAGPTPAPRDIPDDEEAQTGWVRHYVSAIAEQLDLDAFHANVCYEALEEILRAAPPALIWIPGGVPAGALALLRCKGRDALLLAPDGATVRVPLLDLCDRLTQRWRAPLDAWVDDTLAPIALPARRRAEARRRLLAQRLRGTFVTAAWYLREAPHGSILRQAVQIGLRRRSLRLIVSHVLFQAAWILAWMLLGRAVLDGAVDGGWMWGSVTLLMLLVPLRLVGAWSQALVSVGGAGLVKSWLLRGALSLDPADVQRHGSGELIGKSMEAAAFESSAVEGVFMLLLAAIEFLAATIVLLMGASPGWAMLALLIWVGIWLFMMARYRARLRRWTRLRVGMTRELVEQMVGYRTRLVQLPQGLWHHGEDRQVQAYLEESTALDRRHAHLRVLPRAYLVLAVLALVPSFLGEDAATGIAIAVGGIMLMAGALYRLVEGSLGLASAAMAWEEIAPLMAARAQARPRPAPIARSRESRPGEPVLELHDVSHRYAGSDWQVLDRCNLTVRAGDRVLIEGPSGAGKSTLAALAAGMASPQSGLILFRGLDLETLGEEGWRKAIVLAPQFHHNHVFSGSLNFNLFLGNWPPRMQEIEEAAQLFEELGLGPMLAGMPSGLQQVVGENGWMLSHGERSRLFIARALLQRAEVVILDESFAALDPDTLRRAVECARRRAQTLVVVAHP